MRGLTRLGSGVAGLSSFPLCCWLSSISAATLCSGWPMTTSPRGWVHMLKIGCSLWPALVKPLSTLFCSKIGCWTPNHQYDIQVCMSVLCANLVHVSHLFQTNGWFEAKQSKTLYSFWLTCSVWPLNWGWKPKEKPRYTPSNWQNALQNWEINWGPWSQTMPTGNPWILNTLIIIISSHFIPIAPEKLSADFENLSTMNKTTRTFFWWT